MLFLQMRREKKLITIKWHLFTTPSDGTWNTGNNITVEGVAAWVCLYILQCPSYPMLNTDLEE